MKTNISTNYTGNFNTKNRFKDETLRKYDSDVYKMFSRMFCNLPLAGLINKKIFIVHGGLSALPFNLEDIRRINRFVDSPEKCLMANLLWSDAKNTNGFGNGRGGYGISFGPDIANQFLNENEFMYLIRSHEMKDEGYEIHPGSRLITVFSASNYHARHGNRGAYIKFKDETNLQPEIIQYIV